MILEVADLRIQPGTQDAFEKALAVGVTTVIAQSPGYLGYTVHQGLESPERYLLMIRWARLEDHTEIFRGGPLFPQWRAIVGPYFAAPPAVEHFTIADPGA